jgi:cobalt-zinc-cadmium resistance protein CzcA
MFIGPLLLLVVAPALRKIFLSKDETVAAESAAVEGDAVTESGSEEA